MDGAFRGEKGCVEYCIRRRKVPRVEFYISQSVTIRKNDLTTMTCPRIWVTGSQADRTKGFV